MEREEDVMLMIPDRGDLENPRVKEEYVRGYMTLLGFLLVDSLIALFLVAALPSSLFPWVSYANNVFHPSGKYL